MNIFKCRQCSSTDHDESYRCVNGCGVMTVEKTPDDVFVILENRYNSCIGNIDSKIHSVHRNEEDATKIADDLNSSIGGWENKAQRICTEFRYNNRTVDISYKLLDLPYYSIGKTKLY